jgi:transposase-like protein
MARKRLGAEQIVTKLRQIEVLQGQGKTIATACKEVGTTEQNYYRWRKEYGGLGVDQAKRLKQLESENGRLNRRSA